MKVRAIEDYFDLQLNRKVKTGEEFTVSDARGKILTSEKNNVNHPVCEEVTPTTTEKVAKPRKKKQED